MLNQNEPTLLLIRFFFFLSKQTLLKITYFLNYAMLNLMDSTYYTKKHPSKSSKCNYGAEKTLSATSIRRKEGRSRNIGAYR